MLAIFIIIGITLLVIAPYLYEALFVIRDYEVAVYISLVVTGIVLSCCLAYIRG
jgi:hypothetical protein